MVPSNKRTVFHESEMVPFREKMVVNEETRFPRFLLLPGFPFFDRRRLDSPLLQMKILNSLLFVFLQLSPLLFSIRPPGGGLGSTGRRRRSTAFHGAFENKV